MTAGPVNRALLESFFQQPGQIYDDTKTESSFDVIADQIDDNYFQVATLINSGVMSPYIANVQAQSIINGNFAVNQRVKSGTVILTAGQYGHDRWKAGSSGCTYTFATVNTITTITITAGSLVQVIEGLNLYSGTYTLSWTGTAQGKIGAGSFGASGITATVVGGTNLSIEFNVGTLSKVQFNVGSAALPFQPLIFSYELILCQRYYEKSYDYGTAPATATAVGAMASVATSASTLTGFRFKFPKRISSPTISLYSPSGTAGRVWINSDTDISASVSPNNIGDSGCRYLSTGATLTIGTINTFHYTVDAEL